LSRLSNLLFDVRILRFGLVGLLNTALGYAAILAALALGYGDLQSNAMGYAAGLGVSFFLNRRWTFKSEVATRPGVVLRYLAVFLVAYSANLAVVILARSVGLVENPFVHLAAVCLYSLLFYLGSVCFVFVAATDRRHSFAGSPARNEGRVP
jgi:putative flippase GtrA